MIWLEFGVLATAIVLALGVITQIIIPAVKGTRMFPMFRKSGQITRRETAVRTQIDDAQRTLAIDQSLKDATEKEREARRRKRSQVS